jgi:glycosyltransferase involved in cell wall biosynthesis
MNHDTGQNGVSVILCCYNSATRIPETLKSLAAQQFQQPLPFELILVDNASTDNTAVIAQVVWEVLEVKYPLRIIREQQQGLNYARRAGINAANYSILLFCDDDNHLCPEYVQGIYTIMNKNQDIAACGGRGVPLFESEPPAWFHEFAEAYALGPQTINKEDGRIMNLYGAGLAVQKKLLEKLFQSGFDPILVGRTGNKLSSAEDTELTYAFVLMGYSLHYSENLFFYHFLPKERLTIPYLKKLFVAFGTDGPVRNLYYSQISNRPFHKKIKNWYFHLMLGIFRLVKYFVAPPKKSGRMIYFNWNIAYIRKLFSMKAQYRETVQRIAHIRKQVVSHANVL